MERLSEVDFLAKTEQEVEESTDLSRDLKNADLIWVWQKRDVHRSGGDKRYADAIAKSCERSGFNEYHVDGVVIRCLRKGDGRKRPLMMIASIMAPGTAPFFFSPNFYVYFGLMLFIGFLFAWLISSWMFQPLQQVHNLLHNFLERIQSREFGQVQDSPILLQENLHSIAFDQELSKLVHQFHDFLKIVATLIHDNASRGSHLVHEINTPLAIMQNRLNELMQNSQTITPADLISLKSQMAHLSELVRKYFTLSYAQNSLVESDNLYSVDVEQVLTKIIGELNSLYQNRFDLRLRARGVRVLADPLDLEIYFQNLVSNAAKYSPIDQKVEVVLEDQKVEIIDQGTGLPEPIMLKLGKPFNRLKNASTLDSHGLGISICFALNQKYGWQLDYRKTENQHKTIVDFNENHEAMAQL